MKAISILRTTAWTGLLMPLVLGAQAALAEPLVYVPLGGENKIVAIDSAKDEIVDTISGLAAVHGLAGTPDGRFLIAGSFETRVPEGEAVAKPAGVSEDEHAAHHGAAPANAKADVGVSTVSVIQTADGSVVRRIDVPGAVHHVAVSPEGRFAVVTHPNDGAISAIDLESYELVATVATGPLPNYATFDPNGDRIFVSNAGNDTVSEVDTMRWIVRSNAVVGSSPEHVVLAEDGATLYVNNVEDGTVSVLDVGDWKVVETIPIGSTLHGIDLSDDGRTLFVAVLGDDKVVAVDLGTGAERSASLAPAPYHLAVVRGTGKLYVSSADQPKIWVVDQRNLEILGEIPIGGKGHQMVRGANG
jgi:YVTN family beta-propeller protein